MFSRSPIIYRCLVLLAMVPVMASSASAATLNVPGTYTTIQAAINAAQTGDTVVVAPGTYFEHINFLGKAVTVTGTDPTSLSVIQSTTINAGGSGSAVTFAGGEGPDAVLTGLTITGGYGTVNPAVSADIYWGAGIYCYGSSPTITGNVIVGNNAPASSTTIAGYGGGIGCIESSPVITRNVIRSNSAYAGGGIIIYSGAARIASNLIYANTVRVGGGVVLLYGGILINNTIAGNSAEVAGNVYAFSEVVYGQCFVSGNVICDAAGGGGIWLNSTLDIGNTSYNDLWNNIGGDYPNGSDCTGLNGNISAAPQFVDAGARDYHLQDDSPCINAGDPDYQKVAGETDFYGSVRVYAVRVDIGAAEYSDNFTPVADAGPDQQMVFAGVPLLVKLDGSASWDPNGDDLTYHWVQIVGPAVVLSDANAASPTFTASLTGSYQFDLTVNDGQHNSYPDRVKVVIKNDPPVADAGDDCVYNSWQPSIVLDGSGSVDPENGPLAYRWKQIGGWKVVLSDPNAANPSFMPLVLGEYLFELVVSDGIYDSAPDVIRIVVGNTHAPVADAGPSRYTGPAAVTLDGTSSYDPEGAKLTYQWTQVSGYSVTLTGGDTATPQVSGFKQGSVAYTINFQLVVSDGYLTSQPATVSIIVVPNFGTSTLVLANPPFDVNRPTVVAFGGGNCKSGSGMTFGGIWEQKTNWITFNSYAQPYAPYGEMLMVYLSSVAPRYNQPIQMMGFSTGNKPAMGVARYLNQTYHDPRYAINRVSLLDAVCNNLSSDAGLFQGNPIAGEQAWVDSYVSNDPGYNRAAVISGVLNIVCDPARSHGYPVDRYVGSSFEYDGGGITAFGCLSVIGEAKNYQLKPVVNKYCFKIDAGGRMVFLNQSLYPGKILQPVTLIGPDDGAVFDANGVVFSCQPSQNAVGYQLLFGSDPCRVMDYTVVSDTPNPPRDVISKLPFRQTWWTVRAYDQFGSTIYADPMLVKLPDNRRPLANAGADITVHVKIGGTATITLDGSGSSDPDGDKLSYRWVWAFGTDVHEANDVALTLDLPIGVHTFQLMVNDGMADSQPDEVTVAVIENIRPVAEAGPDRTFYADHTGKTAAFVDASASWDPEGRPLTYLWNWTVDGSVVSSTEVAPAMEFVVGTWPFSLVVNDGLDDSLADTAVVRVIAPMGADLKMVPRVLNAKAHDKNLAAIFAIPGIAKADLDPAAPVTLWPFGIQTKCKMILTVREHQKVYPVILAFFDAKAIVDATPKTAVVPVKVETKLRSGRYVVGSDNIMILYPPKHGK